MEWRAEMWEGGMLTDILETITFSELLTEIVVSRKELHTKIVITKKGD